jgi:hypothetical protein
MFASVVARAGQRSVGAGTVETASDDRVHCSNDPVTQYRRRKRTAQAYALFHRTACGIRVKEMAGTG